MGCLRQTNGMLEADKWDATEVCLRQTNGMLEADKWDATEVREVRDLP